MNGYAVAFFTCAFLFLPLRLRLTALMGGELLAKWGVSAYGLPLFIANIRASVKRETDQRPIVPVGVRALSALRRCAFCRRALLRLLRAQRFSLSAELRFRDAALRALAYAFFETLLLCAPLPDKVTVALRCPMERGEGGAELTGILFTRAGSLLLAGALVGLAMARNALRRAPGRGRKAWSIQSTT